MTVVNSWNEWDPLREVIVGSARGAADIGYEPALSPYFPPADAGRSFRWQRVRPPCWWTRRNVSSTISSRGTVHPTMPCCPLTLHILFSSW
jgi:hypothetical protein